MTARRYYRRNLNKMGAERAATYILAAIRYNPCGGRQGVFVDDSGGISLYRPSHPKFQLKDARHLVGVYGATVSLDDLKADLEFRANELAGSDSGLRLSK